MSFSKKQRGEFIFELFNQKTKHPFVFLKGAFQRHFRVFFQSRKAEEKERNAHEWQQREPKKGMGKDNGGGGEDTWVRNPPPPMTPPRDPFAAPVTSELNATVKTSHNAAELNATFNATVKE